METTAEPGAPQGAPKPKKSFQERVEAVIEQIRPAVNMDGGDLELVKADETSGTVDIRMVGACSGCGMSQMTLRMGIERILKARVPEVKTVNAE
ncbi:MAG: NifU family protein [Euryarchaeota archaeon]|nr:NifU family protein [Euryarchaeota archaeon]